MAGLALVNLIQLATVLWLNWRPYDLLLVYWFENVAIGFWTALMVRTARGPGSEPVVIDITKSRDIRVPYDLAFPIYYSFMTLCIGVVILSLMAGAYDVSHLWMLRVFMSHAERLSGSFFVFFAVIAALWFHHGVAFFRDWLAGGEREEVGPRGATKYAWRRLWIIFVAIYLAQFGTPTGKMAGLAPALVLVALKTVTDCWSYLADRRAHEK